MKATKQYFPVVLFIMLYKVVRTFFNLWVKCLSVDDHATESCRASGAVPYAV